MCLDVGPDESGTPSCATSPEGHSLAVHVWAAGTMWSPVLRESGGALTAWPDSVMRRSCPSASLLHTTRLHPENPPTAPDDHPSEAESMADTCIQ